MKKKLFDTSKLEKIAVDNDDAYTLWTVSGTAQSEWLAGLNVVEVSKKIKNLNTKTLAKSFSKEELRTSLSPYISSENEESLRQIIG